MSSFHLDIEPLMDIENGLHQFPVQSPEQSPTDHRATASRLQSNGLKYVRDCPCSLW